MTNDELKPNDEGRNASGSSGDTVRLLAFVILSVIDIRACLSWTNGSHISRILDAVSPRSRSTLLTELTRLKVFYVLLVFALLLIGSSILHGAVFFSAGVSNPERRIARRDPRFLLRCWRRCNCATASSGLEDRTVYTILAKPVPRFEYVLGKSPESFCCWQSARLVMSAAFLLVLFLRRTSCDSRDVEANGRRTA